MKVVELLADKRISDDDRTERKYPITETDNRIC